MYTLVENICIQTYTRMIQLVGNDCGQDARVFEKYKPAVASGSGLHVISASDLDTKIRCRSCHRDRSNTAHAFTRAESPFLTRCLHCLYHGEALPFCNRGSRK